MRRAMHAPEAFLHGMVQQQREEQPLMKEQQCQRVFLNFVVAHVIYWYIYL